MKRLVGKVLGRMAGPCLVAVLAAAGLTVTGAVGDDSVDLPETQPVLGVQGQVHYLPLTGPDFLDILQGQHGGTGSGTVVSPVRVVTSMVSALDGNQITIDHWEDGYDADPLGAPGTTTETQTRDEGQNWILNNTVASPTPAPVPEPYPYDGRDRVVSSGALVMTTGGWPTTAGTVHANAAVVPDLNRFGLQFVAPVGEDVTSAPAAAATDSMWEYTGLLIQAGEDDTTVTLTGGSTFTLDAGETHLVNGGVDMGDTVDADKPVTVYLATGDKAPTSGYEGRMFNLAPTEQWASSYITPVATRATGAQTTRVFLYNPGASAISVTVTPSAGSASSISVPANGTANYVVPVDVGARFSTTGAPFYALHAITTPESGADSSSSYNWGFALTPETALTPMVVIGYGPGAEPTAGVIPENDSAVWVSAVSATRLYIDLNGDPTDGALTDPNGNLYDFHCDVNALQPRLIADDGTGTCRAASVFGTGSPAVGRTKGTGDADMTGARIYTVTDGTTEAPNISAAWGQVSGLVAGAPAIDMGTTVLPFPTIDIVKSSEVVDDPEGDGEAVPGDLLRYTITITNRGISPVDDLQVNDVVPPNTDYVEGSTTAGGNPMPDSGTTPFPLDEGGMPVPPVLGVGQSRTVTYDLRVHDPLPSGVTQILNEITLETDYGTYTDVNITPISETGTIGDRVWNDLDEDGVQDAGEPGLDGVTVELVDDGDVVATEVTGPDGAYTFTDVFAGPYTVRVVAGSLPTGYAGTFDLDGTGTPNETAVSLTEAQDRTDADFGFAAIASLTIDKTVYAGHDGGDDCDTNTTELVTGEAGDDVTYCFTVTNTGGVDLVGVTVDDVDLGVDQTDLQVESGSLASLAPGATVVLSYETAIDGDLTNTATATGQLTPGGPSRSDTDTAAVNEIAPGITLAKTVYAGHDGGASCAGGESVTVRSGAPVTYCFVVTNSGDTNLSAVTFADPSLGVADGDQIHALLTPGQSHTFHVDATADGDLTNTATAKATSPAGAQPTDDDTASVDEVHPSIDVQNTVYAGHTSGAGCDGAESVTTIGGAAVTWCFTVTNTGDVPLTNVTLSDLPLGVDEGDLTVLSGSLATMAPSAVTRLYLQVSASADVSNSVTADGQPAVGPAVTDTDTASSTVIDPSITLEKTVYAGWDDGASCDGDEEVVGLPGDHVTWCFTVTSGADSGPLTNLRLADLPLGVDESDLTLVSGSTSPLAEGATATFFLETDITDDVANTATAVATPTAGPDVSDTDTASVDEVNADITVDKTVYVGHDDGASCEGGELAEDEDGTPLTWCFVVTNSGDATLTNLRLDDADLGIDEGDMTVLSGSLSSISAGGVVVLYVEASLDDDLDNTVTATATPPVGPDVSDEDSASVDELVPSFTVAKTVYRGHDGGTSCQGSESVIARSGAAVTWCILVTNTGDTDLDLQVSDPAIGLNQSVSLAPGANTTLHVETTVDGDLLNTASVDAETPRDDQLSGSDTAAVDEVHPSIDLDKGVYGGHDDGAGCPGAASYADELGQDVTWCFTVTNTGDTTLTDVTLDDADLGIDQSDLTVLSGSLASIPSLGTVVLSLEGTLDDDLVNTATVTGEPPIGPDVSDTDSASVDVLVPGVSVEKTVYRGRDAGAGCDGAESVVGQSGDDITWCFTVTNTGEVPLDVTLDDDQIGFADTIVALAPGATTTVHHDDDIDGDLAPNTVTVTGETPDGDEVSDEDGASVDEIHPAITVDKTVYAGHDAGTSCEGIEALDAEVGTDITWCFVITNTGDAPLTGITLDDAVIGDVDETDVTVLSGSLATLAPGATVRAFYEDVVAGATPNNVTVGGTAPDGTAPTDTDTASVDVIGPQIGISKTVLLGPIGNGDGTYTLLYGIRVVNAGETPLQAVQVTDDLTETFDGARSFRVEGIESFDFTVNPDYDGRPNGSTDLLGGHDLLGVGDVGEIVIGVTVDPGDDLGPYENAAFASGTSPGGEEVDDASDSGLEPDPEDPNAGEPGDTSGTDDPVPVEFPAVDLTVVKGVEHIRRTGTGNTAVIDWRIVVTNEGAGDDPGPITVTDELDDGLSYISATGDGWACDADGQTITCVWDAPLPAGTSTSQIQVLTDATAETTQDRTFINGAHVASTRAEARTDNNDAAANVEYDWTAVPGSTGTLPRTGATVGGLVLLGLGLMLGGRLLQRRARGVAV